MHGSTSIIVPKSMVEATGSVIMFNNTVIVMLFDRLRLIPVVSQLAAVAAVIVLLSSLTLVCCSGRHAAL
ncbi:hypothetical protein J6590_103761 [Homalodisca vitripennis]|nr:hypothetical protein J6590_103761 [Homalodisca vitripennis]